MIVKEAERKAVNSRRAKAGVRAEQDMAFYLRREFGEDRHDVFVFHDLRLVHAGEVVQIDHLVLHRHGIFIIETKSVSGEVHITPSGQFIRHFGKGRKSGMESPVEQVKRQRDLLRKLLIANKVDLRSRKFLGIRQGGFKYCPIELRVAISTNGIIKGEEHAKEVRKADLIPKEIEERIDSHRDGGRLLNMDTSNDDGNYTFSDVELERVKSFLLKQHQPAMRNKSPTNAENSTLEATATEPASPTTSRRQNEIGATKPKVTRLQQQSTSADASRPRFLCSKCQSLKLRILYGKYGYYFKCDDCAGNTWIDTRIDGTDRKGRIRKRGREFYLVCAESEAERLMFVNPE